MQRFCGEISMLMMRFCCCYLVMCNMLHAPANPAACASALHSQLSSCTVCLLQTVIKTLPVEASRAKLSESAAADREGAGSKPGSSAAVAADVSKVSASPFASLGGLSGGVTMLGSGGSSGPLGGLSLSTVGPSSNSARDRALAAARRVPSPEPQPKKEKAKKVSWQKEDALVGVRWFLKVRCRIEAGLKLCATALQAKQ